MSDRRLWFWGTPIYVGKSSSLFFAGNISFHVLDMSRFIKSWCRGVVGGGGRGGGDARRVAVAHGLVANAQHKHDIFAARG